MSQTDITRMSSDYAENELELFRKAVSYLYRISSRTIIMYVLWIYNRPKSQGVTINFDLF